MSDEGRLFAVGDLHGCLDELEVLLDKISPGPDDTIVFLGDYVDRGADSCKLVARLIALSREPFETIFLKGNHEDMFLAFLGYPGNFGEAFLYNGGEATLLSYGVRGGGKDVASKIPPKHLSFFHQLRLMYLWKDLLFVHAGIRPGVPLEEQKERDLLWIREEFFLRQHNLPYTIVFGHTPHRHPLVHLPYKIGIDTGLVYGNKLTCLEATAECLHQVERGGRNVTTRQLDPPMSRKGPA